MAAKVAVPEFVACVIEHCVKGRGKLRENRERTPYPAPATSNRITAPIAAVPHLSSFATVAIVELPEARGAGAVTSEGTAPAAVCHPDSPICAKAEVRCLPELRSRLTRFKSARMAEACW